MYLCLPNFQVAVHKISEILNVMAENRIKVLICSGTLALKSQPCAKWEKVPLCRRDEGAQCRQQVPSCWELLSSQGAEEEPGGSECHRARPAACSEQPVHLQPCSSDYCGLDCNPLIASHF